MCFLQFFLVICRADGQMSGAVKDGGQTDDVNFQALLQSFRCIGSQEASGASGYRSDKDSELERFGYKTSASNDVPATMTNKATALLDSLPSPEPTSQEEAVRAAAKLESVREKLMNEGIVPLWLNKIWIDGTRLACNGYVCSNLLPRLVLVNYFEISKRISDAGGGDALGRDATRRAMNRAVLLQAGYETKYDRTFGIWRITGTNAPVAKSP